MSLMTTTAAAVLTLVGTAAAVGQRGCSRLLAGAAVVMGSSMIAVLVVPGFSNIIAAGVMFALFLAALGSLLLTSMKTRRPLSAGQRTTAGLVIVDTWFMALAMFVMPMHMAGQPQAAAAPMSDTHDHMSQASAPMSGMHDHMSQTAAGDGLLMNALVWAAWIVCAAAVAAPALRRDARSMLPHMACSGSMILAMAVMAL